MTKTKIERSFDVPNEILKELLTDSEMRMIKQRYLIMNLLREGHSIRSIAEQAKVGTDTVVRLARKLENNPRIHQHLKGNSPGHTSKWVFGQVEVEEK